MDIFSLLNETNRRGTTIIVVTHADSIVNQMKKRVISLDKGRVVGDQEKGVYNL